VIYPPLPSSIMVAVGQEAPDFTGRTADGSSLSLSSFRGHPVVLYFYPKANSGGCTMEARRFAQHFGDFQRAGVAVVGVSVDSVEAQKRFADKNSLPFPLVADRDRSIAKLYDVLGFLGMAKRVTFLIDERGRVAEVVEGMLPGPHFQRALDWLPQPPV